MRFRNAAAIIAAAFVFALFTTLFTQASEMSADDVVTKTVSTYKGIRSFRENISITLTSGSKVMKQVSSFIFSRPNKASWKAKGEDAEGKQHIVICCDGKTLVRYNVLKKEYSKMKAPASPSAMRVQGFGFDSTILGLLDGERESIVSGEGRLICKGRDRENCIVLLFSGGSGSISETITYHIDPSTYLLRRLESEIMEGQKKIVINAEFRYSGVGSSLNESLFRFTPPAGAKEKGR
ncbi:MAG: outer membrane lipoprotein carrier protein LolA [Candidatus Xenobiia bacterium LiM19]